MERQEARERVEAASRRGRKGGRTARAREIERTFVQVERARRGRTWWWSLVCCGGRASSG